MDKILFYTNSFEELKEYIFVTQDLKDLGWEVAFSTDNIELAQLMAVGFLLVVKYGTYYPDFLVTSLTVNDDNKLSFEELKESLK